MSRLQKGKWMRITRVFSIVLISCGMTLSAAAQLPPARATDPNPWNGSWKIDLTRSTPGVAQAGVPQVYRFSLGAGNGSVVAVKWEIPELGEVVIGLTDGKPMPIHRTTATPGLTLAVLRDGSSALTYSVRKNGVLEGGGRMMLVDNGAAWVDLTWPLDRRDLASELVYVRQ